MPQDMGLLIDRAAQRQARLQGHMQRMLWDRIRDDERAMLALRFVAATALPAPLFTGTRALLRAGRPLSTTSCRLRIT